MLYTVYHIPVPYACPSKLELVQLEKHWEQYWFYYNSHAVSAPMVYWILLILRTYMKILEQILYGRDHGESLPV